MNALRKYLVATGFALTALPMLGTAGEPAPRPAPQGPDVERRLEDARRRLEAATNEVAELSRQLGRDFVYRLGVGAPNQPRALLGVNIEQSGQKDGAHVRDVSPGGAAEEAGIKAGDIITSLGGLDLTKEIDPGRALVEKMQQAEPNLKVQIGVLRDGKKMNFDVIPRPINYSQIRVRPEIIAAQPPPGGPEMRGERRIEIRTIGEGPDDGARFAGLEFATLSEKLGSYFGVKSGVLVVRAGGNAAFRLQDGDVILAIDGREPTSAQHAGRILRSYGSGEKLKLRIQRDRKAQDLEITMPNVAGEQRAPGNVLIQPGRPGSPRN